MFEKNDLFFEIHHDLPREGPGRDKYTRKAFRMLPQMERPRILDIGCGPGGPTMELARLSKGHIIGLDIHRPYLDRLQKKIKEAGFSDRVEAVKGSMLELDFEEESFDVIWSEGSIFIIGFIRGLREWRRLLKLHGFLVVHEMTWLQPDPPSEIADFWEEVYPDVKTVEENLERIPPCGYRIIGHFPLPEDAWWEEYYEPLEERIQVLKRKYRNNPKAQAAIAEEQREIDLYRKYSRWYGSVFYIMQKL
jgi:ubiquinone/menaquinone biosynthesis C-methylase UbiE